MKDALSTGVPGLFPFSVNPVSDSDLAPGELPLLVRSDVYDISAAASEQVIFSNRFGFALRILDGFMVWSEATEASGPLEGDVTAGTAAGGAQIVAATPYPVSLAVGAVTALTLVTNSLANGAEIFVSHDQAASATGLMRVFFLLAIPQLGLD